MKRDTVDAARRRSGAPIRVEYQLRDYRIRSGEMAEWAAEWRSRVCPLRISFGFTIVGGWAVEGSDRFVWVIGWGGPGTFEDADRDYYRSSARESITPDPARHVVSVETHMLHSAMSAR